MSACLAAFSPRSLVQILRTITIHELYLFLDAYTTDDIEYDWKNDTPVQLKEGLGKSLPSFELQAVNTDYCTSRTNTGAFLIIAPRGETVEEDLLPIFMIPSDIEISYRDSI